MASMWSPEHYRPRGGGGQDRWEGEGVALPSTGREGQDQAAELLRCIRPQHPTQGIAQSSGCLLSAASIYRTCHILSAAQRHAGSSPL